MTLSELEVLPRVSEFKGPGAQKHHLNTMPNGGLHSTPTGTCLRVINRWYLCIRRSGVAMTDRSQKDDSAMQKRREP